MPHIVTGKVAELYKASQGEALYHLQFWTQQYQSRKTPVAMSLTGRKRLRSEDDVGTGGTGGAGPPRRAFLAGRGAVPPTGISWASVAAASTPAATGSWASVVGNAPVATGSATAATSDDEMVDTEMVDEEEDVSNTDRSRFDYMHGRSMIRSQHGAPEVARWPRTSLLLFLTGLPDLSERGPTNQAYATAAMQALREAIEGPDGIMDLTKMGAKRGYERVLGNAEAGRLFQDLRARQVQILVKSGGYNSQLLKAYSRLPVDIRRSNTISRNLFKLAPDGIDTAWVWELLRSSSRSWLDVRFRALRESGARDDDGTDGNVVPNNELPSKISFRADQVNGLIHGADLRLDAFLSQMEFAKSRYLFSDYTRYFETLFKHTYGMDSEVALWLCKSFALIPTLSSRDIQYSGSRPPPG